MDILMRKAENPAKTYLKRYRALLIQRDSLQRSIDAAYARATLPKLGFCTFSPAEVEGWLTPQTANA